MSPTGRIERLSEDARRLHAHLCGTVDGYDRRTPPALDVRELVELLDRAGTDAAAGSWTPVDSALAALPAYADLLALPRHDGHAPHLANLRGAATVRDAARFARHMTRLRRIVRVVAADDPLRKGDRVAILRTRHGWLDGSVTGEVSSDRGDLVLGDDGERYGIDSRRDVRRLARTR